jgi:hypothetical protein
MHQKTRKKAEAKSRSTTPKRNRRRKPAVRAMRPPAESLSDPMMEQQQSFVARVQAPEGEWNALLAQRQSLEEEIERWRQTIDGTRRELDEYERRFVQLSEAIERLSYPHEIEDEMMEQSVTELLRVAG